MVIMQAAREAKLSVPPLISACTLSSCCLPLFNTGGYFSCPQLATSHQTCHIFPIQVHFPASQRPHLATLANRSLRTPSTSQHSPLHAFPSPGMGQEMDGQPERRWMDSPQQATACPLLYWGISSYSGYQSTLHGLSPSRKYSPHPSMACELRSMQLARRTILPLSPLTSC